MVEVNDIINNLSSILFYYIPGYVFLSVLRYCIGRDRFLKEVQVLNSVVLSVIMTSGVKLIFPQLSNLYILACAIITAIIFAIIVSYTAGSAVFSRMFSAVFHRTMNDDFWSDVFDYSGTLIEIDRDKKKYVGYLHKIEKSGSNRWVQISKYKVIDENSKIVDENDGISEMCIQIDPKDTVILSYGKESSYLQKLIK